MKQLKIAKQWLIEADTKKKVLHLTAFESDTLLHFKVTPYKVIVLDGNMVGSKFKIV